MNGTVFVLGAGASAEAGVPMMADFFERAGRVHVPLERADDFNLVAKARALLQTAQSKAWFDLRNVESVFGAFEMAEMLFEKFGTLTAGETRGLSRALRTMIVTTIEETMIVPRRGRNLRPPDPYGLFARVIRHLIDRDDDVSVITFNYDLATELGLHTCEINPDYNLGGDYEPISVPSHWPRVDVLKLHGSLNWTRCAGCNRIHVQTIRDLVRDRERVIQEYIGSTVNDEAIDRLRPSEALRDLKCLSCEGRSTEGDAIIVPPSVYKRDAQAPLQAVWRRAAEKLRAADHIFVIGYSWPPNDLFFHHLYSLGSIGDTILSTFWVCDPNSGVRDRFRQSLIGQQALACWGPSDRADDAYKFSRVLDAIAIHLRLKDFNRSVPYVAKDGEGGVNR